MEPSYITGASGDDEKAEAITLLQPVWPVRTFLASFVLLLLEICAIEDEEENEDEED